MTTCLSVDACMCVCMCVCVYACTCWCVYIMRMCLCYVCVCIHVTGIDVIHALIFACISTSMRTRSFAVQRAELQKWARSYERVEHTLTRINTKKDKHVDPMHTYLCIYTYICTCNLPANANILSIKTTRAVTWTLSNDWPSATHENQ